MKSHATTESHALLRLCQKERKLFFLLDEKAGHVAVDYHEKVRTISSGQRYVIERFQCRGMGSSIVKAVEVMAENKGCSRITASPHPVLDDRDLSGLVEWYQRRGFVSGAIPGELEKSIT